MIEAEYHVIRVTVHILKTSLSVRFPCSLHYNLKSDSSLVQSRTSYELKTGLCEPNQRISLDLQVQVIGEDYYSTKATLGILMISPNGKVPAGSITIPITENGQLLFADREQYKNIDKCPDRLAKVTFKLKIEFIRSLKKHKNTQLMSSSGVRLKNDYANSYTSLNRLVKEYAPKNRFIGSNSHVSKNRSAYFREHRYANQIYSSPLTDRKSDIQDRQKSQKSESIQQNSQIYKPERDEQTKLNIRRWTKQSKQLARQKSHSQFQSRIINTAQQQISRYKLDAQQLMSQISHVKQKNKTLERKQRQQLQQIRQIKDQMQKLRNKANAAQSSNFETKLLLTEKQRTIQQLTEELKILKDYAQQIKMSSNMQQKRIDYKQLSLNQQLNKMTEKYQQSQQQRQKMMIEMNNMLNQYQSAQKKNLLQYKEKEKNLIEQKNKLIRKIQIFNVKNQELTEENSHLIAQLEHFKSNNKSMNKNKTTIEQELSEVSSKFNALTLDYKKLQATSTQNNLELNQLRVQTQNLSSVQKKYNELILQFNKLKQEQSRKTRKIDSLNKSIKQLQNYLKQAISNKDTLNVRSLQLSKQLQTIKKINESKEIQILNEKQSYSNLQTRFEQFKLKFEKQKAAYEEICLKAQNQLIFLSKSKENLFNQFYQLKWKLKKTEQNAQNLRSRMSQLNQKNLKTSEELMSEQQKCKSLRQINKQLEGNLNLLKGELITKQLKQKQLQHLVKTKSDIQYELNKILREKQQQISLLREKQFKFSIHIQQQRKRVQILTEEKYYLQKKHAQQVQLSLKQQKQSKVSKDELQREFQRLREECRYYKSGKDELQRAINGLQIQISNQNKLKKEFENQILSKSDNERKILDLVSKKEEQNKNIKLEFQRYKQQIHRCFETFVNQLCRDPNNQLSSSTQSSNKKQKISKTVKHHLLSFPDESLSNLQYKAIKKKNQIQYKYNQTIKNLEQTSDSTAKQIIKIKQTSSIVQRQLQSAIQEYKLKYKDLQSKSMGEKNQWMEKINLMEQKIHQAYSQKEKTNFELHNAFQEIKDLKRIIKQKNEQKQQLEKQIFKTYDQKLQLIKNVDHLKKNANSELVSINQENKIHLQKQRITIKQLEKKIAKQENQAKQYQKIISNLENSLTQQSYELDKSAKKFQFSEKKGQQLKSNIRDLKDQIQMLQKKIMQQIQSNNVLSKELETQRIKKSEFQLKYVKLIENTREVEQSNEKLHFEIGQLNQQLKQSSLKLKRMQEIEKQNSQTASTRIKQMEEKIIGLKSQLQLKDFLHKQIENSYNETKTINVSNLSQIQNKKKQITFTEQIVDNLKNQLLQYKQNNQILKADKSSLLQESKKLKEKIELYERQQMNNSITQNILDAKHRQNQKLKNQLLTYQSKYESTSRELKQIVNEFRKQSTTKMARQEQFKKKIRDMEKQLSNKAHELGLQNQRLQQLYDNDKNQLIRQLQLLDEQNQRLRVLYQNTREQSRKQLQLLNQQCAELTGLLTQKEQIMCSKDDKLRQAENKIKLLTSELRQCFQAWENEKKESKNYKSENQLSKAAKIMNQIDARGRLLLTSFTSATLR